MYGLFFGSMEWVILRSVVEILNAWEAGEIGEEIEGFDSTFSSRLLWL